MTSFLLAASALSLWAQGPLQPPGAPAPTMKSLEQIEPRKPISSLPVVIDQPGSYYVTANLTGVSGQNGINVTVADVTIDLMGHTLTGVAGSLTGIFGGAQNITVRNGSVVKWGGAGVFLAGMRSRAQAITALENGTNGIELAGGSIAVDCIASGNDGSGIRLVSDGVIERCEGRDNTGVGLRGGFATVIAQSSARGNDGNGIEVGDGGTVQGCTAISNDAANIKTGSGALVARCTAQLANGSAEGILVGADCLVLENEVRENGGSGIRAIGVRSRIESNHSNRNAVGIDVQLTNGNSLVIKNSASGNTNGNFSIASGNRVGLLVAPTVNNATITGNTGGTSIPEPWANFAY